MTGNIWVGILIPFLGTTLGAGCVFFLKRDLRPIVQKSLLGFASGVMVAASVWSLLIPALDMAEKTLGKMSIIPASTGFLLGIGFLLLLDRLIPHLHLGEDKPEGLSKKLKKTTMLILAVTLHNIPEGMAVGAVFAGIVSKDAEITLMGAFALSIGIAIQNFPEGAIISIPLRSETNMNKGKAFTLGALSGIVEPIAAVCMFFLADMLESILPYILSFAAGAMIYVVIEELIPETTEGEHSNSGTVGFALGFVLMMIMDVTLG